MIGVHKECDFSIIIADFIETLDGTDKFTLKIWLNTSELPYEYSEKSNFYFMQEGVRIMDNQKIDYIFYDVIVSMRIEYES